MAMQLLEIKRLKLELVKVAAARNELEFRVDERMDEVARITEHIQVQLDKEKELTERIATAEKEVADETKALILLAGDTTSKRS